MKNQNSEPRNIRYSKEALAAIKILEDANPDKSRAEVISEAIINQSNCVVSKPAVKFSGLKVHEFFLLQAEYAKLSEMHREMKRQIMRLRVSDLISADKISSVVIRAQKEMDELERLKNKISELSGINRNLKADDKPALEKLLELVEKRLTQNDKGPEMIRAWEIELMILKSIILE